MPSAEYDEIRTLTETKYTKEKTKCTDRALKVFALVR